MHGRRLIPPSLRLQTFEVVLTDENDTIGMRRGDGKK